MRNELRPLRTTCKPLRNRYPAKVGLLGVTCLTMVSYQGHSILNLDLGFALHR